MYSISHVPSIQFHMFHISNNKVSYRVVNNYHFKFTSVVLSIHKQFCFCKRSTSAIHQNQMFIFINILLWFHILRTNCYLAKATISQNKAWPSVYSSLRYRYIHVFCNLLCLLFVALRRTMFVNFCWSFWMQKVCLFPYSFFPCVYSYHSAQTCLKYSSTS